MTDPTPAVASAARGVAARVKNALLSLDRQDRLESARAFVGWLESERAGGGLEEAAREMLLRALRLAGDPVNFAILERLGELEPVELADLVAATGLGRLAVSERVHDLAQTGLAVRELVNDEVRGTELTSAVCGWVGAVARAAAAELAADLGRREAPP